jgi:hypothetical protein
LKYADGFSGRRNDIAHGKVMSFREPDGSITFLLYPPFYNSKKITLTGDTFVYSATTIRNQLVVGFENTFRKVHGVIKALQDYQTQERIGP